MSLSDRDLHRFLRRCAPLLGIRWRKYRRRQSKRGLLSRLEELGIDDDLDAYARVLRESPEERERLVRAMRVTVSRFWRDREVWEGLESEVLPTLLAELSPGRALRVWSCGCASGEEPYSFVLLWSRLPEKLRAGRGVEILATDLDEAVLERARRAEYAESSLRQLPPALRREAFRETDGELRLRDPYRAPVELRHADLLEDPPPQGCDLVLCRYLVFTYFRGERLAAGIERLLAALEPGGALAIGRREEFPGPIPELEPWPSAPRVYRRLRRTEAP